MKCEPQYGRTGAKPQARFAVRSHVRTHRDRMKFAICNETFGDRSFADTFSTIRKLGYTGVEIAPFTFAPRDEPFDVRRRAGRADRRSAHDGRGRGAGDHRPALAAWRRPRAIYLTSPDPTVRRRTAEYLRALAEVCADLGGKIMVLGSPKQRNLLPGVSYDDAEAYAAEVLHAAMPACAAVRRDDRPRAARPGRGRLSCSPPKPASGWRRWSTRRTASCTST